MPLYNHLVHLRPYNPSRREPKGSPGLAHMGEWGVQTVIVNFIVDTKRLVVGELAKIGLGLAGFLARVDSFL